MKRAKQMSPEKRRHFLLDIAIKVFAEKGIDSAKHGDVAKAAKVSVPTVHAYFKTRGDLVEEVLNEVGRFISEECTYTSISQESYEERMKQSGLILVEAAKQKPEYFKVWIMWGACFGEPYKTLYEQYLSRQTQLLAVILTGDKATIDTPEVQEKARMLEGLTRVFAQFILRDEKHVSHQRFIESVSYMLR